MNVRLICQVLGEAGHGVDLLVFPTGQDVKLKNVNIIRVPNLFRVRHIPAGPSVKKLAFDFIITLFACCLLVTRKYDVINLLGIKTMKWLGNPIDRTWSH